MSISTCNKSRFEKNSFPELGNLETILDPMGMSCEKLTGHELYRIRQGNYRIIYSIQDNELTVWVVKVGHRKDVYR